MQCVALRCVCISIKSSSQNRFFVLNRNWLEISFYSHVNNAPTIPMIIDYPECVSIRNTVAAFRDVRGQMEQTTYNQLASDYLNCMN